LSGRHPRALVLGGGLAGLRGAIALAEAGAEVEVVERLDEPGGMARSLVADGYVFDHGPHGFFSRDAWIVDEFRRLLGEDGHRWLTKWSQIHYRGRYFNYPLRLADLLGKMDAPTLARTLASFLAARARAAIARREPANAEEYLVERFGRALTDAFFGPYTEKVWAIPPRELDADFARDRVPSLHLWDVIRDSIVDPARRDRAARARVTPSGRIATHDLHRFYYPRRGARALPDAYAAWARALGVRLRLAAEVERLDLGARVARGRSAHGPWEVRFDALLNTIPLDHVVPLVAPRPPADVAASAAALRYRAILLVCLGVCRPRVIGPFWIYYTDRFFNRLSEIRHFSPDLAPEGKTGVCLEIGCDAGDAVWNAPDGEIVERVVAELVDLELVARSDVERTAVIREAHAYPIYDLGFRERVARIVSWLEAQGPIATAGRQGRFLYINQDAAIKSGFEAARSLTTRLAGGGRDDGTAEGAVAREPAGVAR
jgi:protoporphyrinogen oxidase